MEHLSSLISPLLDGLHLEVQIIHLPEVQNQKSFTKITKDTVTKCGVLKNNTVDAKLQIYQHLDHVDWDDVVLTKDQRKALEKNIVKFIDLTSNCLNRRTFLRAEVVCSQGHPERVKL